jgi:hypothetical protein
MPPHMSSYVSLIQQKIFAVKYIDIFMYGFWHSIWCELIWLGSPNQSEVLH